MGCLLRILGRVLFVILFVGAGVQKVTDPSSSAQYLVAMYPGYHKWYTSSSVYQQVLAAIPAPVQPYVNQLNDLLQPAFIADHAKEIITFIGYLQLSSSALVLFSVQLAGFALFAFTIATILIIHNPFVNPLTFHAEFVNAITNLAIAGIALFIAADICPQGASSGNCHVKKDKQQQRHSAQAQSDSKVKQSKQQSQVSQPKPKQKK